MTTNHTPLLATALLGAGGHSPGLVGYDVLNDRTEQPLSLQESQSVYALARSSDSKCVAVGTRGGDIYVLDQQVSMEGALDVQPVSPIHNLSTPILSVAFLDSKTLAVTDTAGRCGVLNLDNPTAVHWLQTGQRVICALFRLDSKHLAGLSLSGELLKWDCSSGGIVNVMSTPALPEIGALVRPVYWPAKESWVWPGKDGLLVLYCWQQQKTSAIRAHRGEVYAVTVRHEELLSIGRTDASLKRWQAGSIKPTAKTEVPSGVVAATCWAREKEAFLLLVDDTGKAGLFSLSENRLELCRWLPGGSYRAVLAPDIQAYESLLLQQRNLQAQELAQEIQDHIFQGKANEVDHLYAQLTEMGYEHIACALQAEAARQDQDLVAELKAYTKLAQILPLNQPESASTLQRYARLLETLRRQQKACTIYKHLLQIDSHDPDYASSHKRLSEQAYIMKSGPYVIEADIPLLTLIKAAVTLDEPFTGRYLYQAVGNPISCGVLVSAKDLIGRYRHIAKSKKRVPLPPAEHAELCWLSSEKRSVVSVVLFCSDHPNLCKSVELGIKLHNVHLQTILEPVILFNADDPTAHTPGKQHNSDLLEMLYRIKHDTRTRGWLETVYTHARQAARQVITKAMAESIGKES
jgi:hypothetical protein